MVSIVVATYNRCNFLEDCIKSYEEQNCDKSLFEVLIIDNNSTDDTEIVSKEVIEKYSENVPLGRMASVEECVMPILFLLGDDSTYITGSDLVVDGGWTSKGF